MYNVHTFKTNIKIDAAVCSDAALFITKWGHCCSSWLCYVVASGIGENLPHQHLKLHLC